MQQVQPLGAIRTVVTACCRSPAHPTQNKSAPGPYAVLITPNLTD